MTLCTFATASCPPTEGIQATAGAPRSRRSADRPGLVWEMGRPTEATCWCSTELRPDDRSGLRPRRARCVYRIRWCDRDHPPAAPPRRAGPYGLLLLDVTTWSRKCAYSRPRSLPLLSPPAPSTEGGPVFAELGVHSLCALTDDVPHRRRGCHSSPVLWLEVIPGRDHRRIGTP